MASLRFVVARKLLPTLVLLWSAAGFAYEARGAVIGYLRRAGIRSHPVMWRFGMSQVELLERCAAGVRQRVPAGSLVAFSSPGGNGNAEFFRWRWAAYLLPEYHVLPMNDPATAQRAQFVVAFRSEFHHRRARPIARLPSCSLYRVRK